MFRTILNLFLASIVLLSWAPWAPADESWTTVQAVIKQNCVECHNEDASKGELNLTQADWSLHDAPNRSHWVKVHDRVAAGEMPPAPESLSDADRESLLAAIASAVHRVEREAIQERGRGALRRLTRTEYEDNLRDVLQLPDLDVADRLPEDRNLHGFRKVSGLLDMSRVQLAGYLDAARTALEVAVASGAKPPASKQYRFTGMDLFPAPNTFGEKEAMFFARKGSMVSLHPGQMTPEQQRDPTLELALFRSATWPYYGYPRGFRAQRDGRYRVKFSARAVRQLPGFRLVSAYDPLAMSFRARQPSGPDVSGDVRETGGWMDLMPETQEFETTVLLKDGETFEYSLLGLPVPFIRTDGGFFYDFPPMPHDGHRGAAFQWLEVSGPLSPAEWPPESHRVLFGDLPIKNAAEGGPLGVEVLSSQPHADAERLFRRFARTASRRPLDNDSQAAFLALIDAELNDGAPLAEAMLQGYQAFLCSGHFLYLTEPQHDEYALASRLSHLLWNSRPDEALLDLAANGHLGNRQTLLREVDRMIEDDRFGRFINNFTTQWLELGQVWRDNPDIRLYPEYRKDDYLVASMERETRAFVKALIRDNLPVSMLVDADFAFVNDRLAAHYGLRRQSGSAMRRVQLPEGSPYGGLLTQAAVLKLTSNGTTTSPVMRGAWVMDKLLGEPPPPPPKSVPAIAPDIRGATTIRELLARHTESESCAACHARFDPVGFALENFDIMGAWRDRYRGLEAGEKITGFDRAGHPFEYRVGREVDASGQLRSGESFQDVGELKRILAAKPRRLARGMLGHLTLYATGTPVQFVDRPEIEEILSRTAANGYRVGDLLRELVASRIFAGSEPEMWKAEAETRVNE